MIWPVYRYGDRSGACTGNLFDPGKHDGVDIGWAWRPGDPVGLPNTDPRRHWTIIPDARALCAEDGIVVYAEWRPRGFAVRIRGLDRVAPLDRCYFHGQNGPWSIERNAKVLEGRELFVIGADPTDPEGWRHLHFETRRRARKSERGDGYGCIPIDPWPELRLASFREHASAT